MKSIILLEAFLKSLIENDMFKFFGIIGPIVIAILFPIISSYKKTKEKKRKVTLMFPDLWVKGTELVYDVIGREFFSEQNPKSQRIIDKEIKEALDGAQSIVLVGESLSGKTYYALSLFSRLEEAYVLTTIRTQITQIEMPEPPKNARYKILFLDDFHDYITSNSEYIRYLIEQAIKKGYVVWCNTNYTNLDDVMEHLNPTGSYKIIEIKKDLSYDEALRIANEIGLNGVPEHFDGNIGSIFYQLDKKSETYRKLSPNQKMILKAIKVLYHFGLYTPISGIKKQDLKRLVKIWEEFHFRAFEEDMQRLAAIKFIDESKQADFVQYEYQLS